MMKGYYLSTGLMGLLAVGTATALIVFSNDIASSQANHHGHGTDQTSSLTIPTMVGQDAFATIQEIVEILEADQTTDWNQVDLIALREHLIDMHEVTLNAAVEEGVIEGGLQVLITGKGRTKDSIQRLVPAHSQELNQSDDLQTTVAELPDGIRLTMTSNDPQQVDRIRALGFIGLLVQGSHHQSHHLAIARGIDIH
jgi:hypothetical protein